MIIVVSGGRYYDDVGHVFRTLDAKAPNATRLMHGACTTWSHFWKCYVESGADWIAEAWALARGIPVTRFPARWSELGPGAGPARNFEMVDSRPDKVFLFPGSSGTHHMWRAAVQEGVPFEWV